MARYATGLASCGGAAHPGGLSPIGVNAAASEAKSEDIGSFTDEQLIHRIRAATHECEFNDLFQELFRRYRLRVMDWCFRIVKDSDRSADLAQEVFLRAFQRLHTFRAEARFSTWLYAITRNHCLNALKKRRIVQADNGDSDLADLPGADGNEVHSALERMESFQHLWRLMRDALTPLETRVMALHYGHELPLATITRRLALSNPSGAKAYIVNARRKLNATLGGRQSQPATHSRTYAAVADRSAR